MVNLADQSKRLAFRDSYPTQITKLQPLFKHLRRMSIHVNPSLKLVLTQIADARTNDQNGQNGARLLGPGRFTNRI